MIRAWVERRRQHWAVEAEYRRWQGLAAAVLDGAVGDEVALSSGGVSVNGTAVEDAYTYRLTATRLLWNRAHVGWGRPVPDGRDPGVTELRFADVESFQIGEGGRVDFTTSGGSTWIVILPTGDGIAPGPLFAAHWRGVMERIGALITASGDS